MEMDVPSAMPTMDVKFVQRERQLSKDIAEIVARYLVKNAVNVLLIVAVNVMESL